MPTHKEPLRRANPILKLMMAAAAICLAGAMPGPVARAQTQDAATLSVPDQLATIQRDITWLTQEIVDKRRAQAQRKASGEQKEEDEAEAEQDIADLEQRLQRARLSFITTAADVELPPAEDKSSKPQKRDLVQEAQQLIEPIFDAVRRVSEKPRRIEALRTRAFYLRDRIGQIDRAVSGLDHAIRAKSYPSFDKQLDEAKRDLLHERDELQVSSTAVDHKLSQELEDHRTLMQVLTEDVAEFVATKGKNLSIALLVFALTLWSLLRVKKGLLHSERVRLRLRGLVRPFHAAYWLVSLFASVFAAVFTLHFLNDWFLASLIMLGLLATIWALKTVLHHFIAELKLLLNLGSAKQGERVVWMGIPWLIKSLGFRSILVNEALQGGTVSLPAATLSTLLSRETAEGEPWFPTRAGDYVQLDDGVYGRVELQTPETVIVASGNSRKHYPTASYLARNPQNFSQGFEVSAEQIARAANPVDCAPGSTKEVEFREAVRKQLQARLGGASPDFQSLSSGLIPGGSERLRAWVCAECPGRLAVDRDIIKRELQQAIAAGLLKATATAAPSAR